MRQWVYGVPQKLLSKNDTPICVEQNAYPIIVHIYIYIIFPCILVVVKSNHTTLNNLKHGTMVRIQYVCHGHNSLDRNPQNAGLHSDSELGKNIPRKVKQVCYRGTHVQSLVSYLHWRFWFPFKRTSKLQMSQLLSLPVVLFSYMGSKQWISF